MRPQAWRKCRGTGEIETDPEKKDFYGALKSAIDEHLYAHCPEAAQMSLVRPGFILASDLDNPIVGIGARLPWNNVFIFGDLHGHIPVIPRELMHRAIRRAMEDPPTNGRPEVLLLADAQSPTRSEYLKACSAPWERGHFGLLRKVRSVCRKPGCMVQNECCAENQTIDGPCWHRYDALQD